MILADLNLRVRREGGKKKFNNVNEFALFSAMLLMKFKHTVYQHSKVLRKISEEETMRWCTCATGAWWCYYFGKYSALNLEVIETVGL